MQGNLHFILATVHYFSTNSMVGFENLLILQIQAANNEIIALEQYFAKLHWLESGRMGSLTETNLIVELNSSTPYFIEYCLNKFLSNH